MYIFFSPLTDAENAVESQSSPHSLSNSWISLSPAESLYRRKHIEQREKKKLGGEGGGGKGEDV